MESTVEAALAAKMLKLFPPTPEELLAFPVAGAGLTLAELALFERPGESAEEIRLRTHHRAQFARLVNQVPVDALRWAPEDRTVWGEYKRALDDAEMAATVLTASERTSLERATAYLTDTVTTDGVETRVYSSAVQAYYQYGEVAEKAERAYLDELVTAQMSQDPAVRAAWENGRRLQLEAERDRARQDLAVLGHQAEVEAAQATVAALGAKDPQVRRLALLGDYEACTEPDLVGGDPVGVQSTFYSPSDVFTPSSTWNTLHVSADEVSGLLAEVPPELAASATGGPGSIVSLTVEYASVSVVRPWFDPTFLAMRSWRLPEGDVLSDGGVPRHGRLPGYVSDLVVARKVTVERTVPAGAPPTGAGRPVLADLAYLSSAVLQVDQTWRVQPQFGPVAEQVVPAQVVAAIPTAAQLKRAAPDVSVLSSAFLTAKAERTTITELPSLQAVATSGLDVARAPVGLMARVRADGPGDGPVDGGDGPLRPFPGKPHLPPHLPPGMPPPPVDPGPTVPATTQVTEEVTLDGVVVLAYRVRRTPASPDPDPALTWDGSEPAAGGAVEQGPGGSSGAGRFPLPAQHVFGVKGGPRVHDGSASAADRVAVLAIESALHRQGAEVKVDGVLGEKTGQAVRRFQRTHGLVVDGRVGPRTWKVLLG